MTEQKMSLRARTRAMVKQEVRSSALRLFESQGYEETTVAQIAADSGISQSSFFRYFPSKEHVAVETSDEFPGKILDALKERPDDEPVWVSLRRALAARTAYWQENPDLARQMRQLTARSESIRSSQRQQLEGWREELMPEVVRRLGEGSELVDLRATALISSAFSCLDAAFQRWSSLPDMFLDDLFASAADAVRPESE